MLAQEWDWNKALEINARDAVRAVNEQWKTVVANKDAALADKDAKWKATVANKDAEIEALKAKLSAQQRQ